MGCSDQEVIVDQVGNLSTSKETVLFLGLLFLQTDSPFELGIMDDFVQCRSNPRIKYFKIWRWNTSCWWRRFLIIRWINQLHFFDPQQSFRRKLCTSTYVGLESYLPARKRGWRGEFVEMKIRNLQSLVCPIIHWRVSFTEDDWIFGWRSGLASLILNFFLPFTFLHCGRNGAAPRLTNSIDAILEDKVLLMTHLGLQKRFPIYHLCPKCLAALLCGSAL